MLQLHAELKQLAVTVAPDQACRHQLTSKLNLYHFAETIKTCFSCLVDKLAVNIFSVNLKQQQQSLECPSIFYCLQLRPVEDQLFTTADGLGLTDFG